MCRLHKLSRLGAALTPIAVASLNIVFVHGASPGEEMGIWKVWTAHVEQSEQHAKIVGICEKFKERASDPGLKLVADGIASWHLMKQGKDGEVTRHLRSMLSARNGSFQNAASEIARSWLTRYDREQVKAALQEYYCAKIEYPYDLERLTTMPELESVPLEDRWNRKWKYRLVPMEYVQGVSGQQYELASRKLDGSSDLQSHLEQDYRIGLELEPKRVLADGKAVAFREKGSSSPLVLNAGQSYNGIDLVCIGRYIIVLSDGNYWILLRRPQKG